MSDQWLIEEDINEILRNAIRKFDYDLEFADDRNDLVKKILHNIDNELELYLASPGYVKKQVKTKDKFLAESEPFGKLMMRFSYYLDFPKYNNEENKINESPDKNNGITMNRIKTINKNELRVDDLQTVANNIYRLEHDPKVKKKDMNFKLVPNQEVTTKDRQDYSELNDYCLFLESINKILGYESGVNKDQRSLIHEKLVEEKGQKYMNMVQRVRSELIKELPIIKDRIRGTIYFKRLSPDTTVYNLNNDTGYLDEQGEYITVSENKIYLNDEQHIFALIDNYSDLKEGNWDKPDSDISILIYELENLIDQTEFEPYEKDILIMKIDKLTGEEICANINQKYGIGLTEDTLSRTYTSYIPKKIVETNNRIYEEWIYTYKKKGKYKTCRKCGETKLIVNDKYFGKHSQSKDGFQPTCKKCDAFRKNSN